MDSRDQLAEQLAFLADLGVNGFSKDASWRSRGDAGEEPDKGLTPVRSGPDTSAQDQRSEQGLGPDQHAARQSIPEVVVIPESPELFAPAHSGHETLPAIRADLGDCTRCKLSRLGRQQIVFGVGNPRARLMFVGEAPGRDEDIQGIPFVGRAGQLLTKMIEAMGLRREDVYIANVIKCRPPENRNPEPDEVASCEPFLFRQVESIAPVVIVALGTFAAQALLRTNDAISRLRGRVYKYGGAKLVASFHPAYLLRSPEKKRDAWEDLKRAKSLLDEAESNAGRQA